MIYTVKCAFINNQGKIGEDCNDFSASEVNAAKVAAQEYFTDKHSDCTEFIYTTPQPRVTLSRHDGVRMTQINHGKARGVQIVGNAVGTTIVTGDSVIGGLHIGDEIVLS